MKYSGATHAKNQNVEATQKYRSNTEMKAWIADNIISDGVFFDVVFIDPSKAVHVQQAIGEAKGDAAMHFRKRRDPSRAYAQRGKCANTLHSMYQSKTINREIGEVKHLN